MGAVEGGDRYPISTESGRWSPGRTGPIGRATVYLFCSTLLLYFHLVVQVMSVRDPLGQGGTATSLLSKGGNKKEGTLLKQASGESP